MKKKLRPLGFPAQNAFAFAGFPANFSRKSEKSIRISVDLYYFSYLLYFEFQYACFAGLFIFYAFDYYSVRAICLFLHRLPFRRFEWMIGP
ncbi:hypothetical protein [Rhizobium rhizogenes]|uniref:hypothetical protein n=1 Tax=Rhizobium rhizogenes TaxID=359 RepID=UPI0022C6D248|nr:hypothetical protein [Rhizobium rhizogenes]MCZ7485817.1 hypothetical protein [Rhizobium rhizogenes]